MGGVRKQHHRTERIRRIGAASLYLGGGTIKTHVSNVLAKLGLRDRMHAVVFAFESGLVGPGRS